MYSVKIEDITYEALSQGDLSQIKLSDIKSIMIKLRISPCAQSIFEKIYIFIRYGGKAFPGNKYLAMKIGVSSRTIRRALGKLVQSKMIIIEERQGTTNRYHIRPEQLSHILIGRLRASTSRPGHSVHPP
ncbi:GntR family transcriptional regulator, partial [Desulfovibrio sp. X2]|uniref:GntR family transcriptional regulator n=1 Tax=Desulfovibrio sp. X2 TaxID=941449 RepID=UPI0012691D72